MRTFKLWNAAESSSINLSSGSIQTTEVSGLGTVFANPKKEHKGKRYVVETYHEFEDITLQIVFGIDGNAYADYKSLMDLIAANGDNNLILEYYNGTSTRYVDVRVKRTPKTQKDSTSTMSCQIVFERLTPYYEKVSTTYNSATNITITNAHPRPIELRFSLAGNAGATLDIYLKNTAGTVTYRRIQIQTSGVPVSITTVIDAYTKKVTNTIGGTTSNAYSSLNRSYDSFILVDQGSYRLDIPIYSGGSTVLSYKKWVID